MDSKQIEAQALAWLAKRDSGRWSAADEREFAEWLRAQTANRVAFLRLEASWERSALLKVFGTGRRRGQVPPPGEWRSSPFFDRGLVPATRPDLKTSVLKVAAVAAGVLLMAGAGLYLKNLLAREGYTTPVGGIASIVLRDGSSMTLNTESKARVAMSATERRIELEAGEAFFDVAKDPSRPFVVEIGRRRVIAVGTSFSVRRDGEEIQVIVTEGKVRIEPKEGGAGAELLAAGAVMQSSRNSLLVQKKTPIEAEEALSWRSGYLTFEEMPLADAVSEFNRYTTQRIVIDDPKLAALRINGKFRSTNAEDFVLLLQNGFGIRVREAGSTVHLTAN